jgi:hypothetical protein
MGSRESSVATAHSTCFSTNRAARPPYPLVKVSDGNAFRTRAQAAAIRAAFAINTEIRGFTKLEAGVLAAIAYEQPITHAALSERFGREIGRDLITALRDRAPTAPMPRAVRLCDDGEVSGDVRRRDAR